MFSCEQCRERLVDYVYGLLEDIELHETREHLHSCADCQAALDEIQAEQTLMARAAKAIEDVPEFHLPTGPETIVQETAPSPSPSAPTFPSPAASNPPPKRPFWQRPWIAWVVAVSLLGVIVGSYSFHHYRLSGLQKELAHQKSQFRDIEIAYEALPAKYETLQKRELETLRAVTDPYVHILGPAQLQPNSRGQLHITTRNADGQLAAANVRVKLMEAQTGNVVQVARLQSDREGQALLELDASKAKPGSTLQVHVEADFGTGQALVKDMIRLQPPTYVTRVDMNKIVYQIGDVVFFRVLVLDRCSLQPPTQPILLRVVLKNPKDEVVARLDAPTSEGGILAREFPVASHFLAGHYTLSVSPLDPAQTLVQTATQRLEVVRDLRTPEIQLDQDRYLPGDTITGVVRGNAVPDSATGQFGNAAPVPVTVELGVLNNGPAAPGGGVGGGGGFNAKDVVADKKATSSALPMALHRFSAKLPSSIPQGARYLPFTLEFQNGQKKQAYRGVVPLQPTDYEIDFFPEGGDLIAGVPNRVYYRVRSGDGDAVTSNGRVILMTGKNEIVDSRYQLGLGYLDFTPDTKETYTVRITTPLKTAEIAQPFKMAIRPAGVVLHIPSAVGKQGDAIRLTLRNQGPARKVLLAAHCRGQVVDQRWVDVKTGSQDFTLQPAQDARGMIKVTAYEMARQQPDAADKIDAAPEAGQPEPRGTGLLPLAERLVYRTATQRLELTLQTNTRQYEPGKNLQLRATARTELGEPANGWLLASIVDERFQTRSRSLSAHFLLLNEIRTGSELEDAQVVLHDAPESTALLERFLGTHGWRRFLNQREPGLAVLARPKDSSTLIFSRENASLEQMQKNNEARQTAALQPLRKAAFTEEIELKAQRSHLAAVVALAENQLQQFEQNVQLTIRLTLGTLVAVLLLTSLGLMSLGIYRIVRQHRSATPVFGGAFGCLAACLIVMFVGSWLGPVPSAATEAAMARAMGRRVEEQLIDRFAQDGAQRVANEPTPPVGAFTTYASKPDNIAMAALAHAEKKHEVVMKDAAAALQQQQIARMARLDQNDRAGYSTKDRINSQNLGLEPYFRRSEGTLTPGIAKAGDKPKVVPELFNPKAKGGKNVKGEAVPPQVAPHNPGAVREAEEVEYAFKYAPTMFADTLLWHPHLQLVKGEAEARFDIAVGQASYRVLLLGHTPSGRFGFLETRFDVLSVGK